ncbi:MAG: hypothetical protein AABZ10_06620 [Nitrospirota bacterium]
MVKTKMIEDRRVNAKNSLGYASFDDWMKDGRWTGKCSSRINEDVFSTPY